MIALFHHQLLSPTWSSGKDWALSLPRPGFGSRRGYYRSFLFIFLFPFRLNKFSLVVYLKPDLELEGPSYSTAVLFLLPLFSQGVLVFS